jgi:hypothetical protein
MKQKKLRQAASLELQYRETNKTLQSSFEADFEAGLDTSSL